MKIQLLGSNGIIGNGIIRALNNYKIQKLNSESYDKKKNIYKLKKFKKCNYFIHAAGITEEEISKDGFENSFKRSSIELIKLLNHLKKNNCKNYIYISSLRLYDEKINFLNEKKNNLKIDSDYKLCHFVSENIIKFFAIKNNFNFLILRPGAVYGFPKNKFNIKRLKLIPYSFPLSLFKKNKISLNSSGEQYRSFCSNIDIGLRIKKWINLRIKTNLISNIKGDKTITVKNFAKLCIKVLKKKNISYKLIINKKNKKKYKPLKINQNFRVKNKGNLSNFLKDYFKTLSQRN